MHAHHHARPAPFQAPVVLLDGEEIPPAEIAAEMQHHPAPEPGRAWHAAAEALVVKRLLLAEAARQGIAPAPAPGETEEEALVRQLMAAELRIPEADDATCRRWYDANPARFRSPDTWAASHILVAADPADAAARADARARAEAALAEVAADPARLPALAAALSDCPSRQLGGELGQLSPGSTVPEFEAALRVAPVGAPHGELVETRYGFHVLMLHGRAPGEALPFEAVRARIAAWLEDGAWRRAARQYMALLAARARVEGIVLSAGADGPLVQ